MKAGNWNYILRNQPHPPQKNKNQEKASTLTKQIMSEWCTNGRHQICIEVNGMQHYQKDICVSVLGKEHFKHLPALVKLDDGYGGVAQKDS